MFYKKVSEGERKNIKVTLVRCGEDGRKDVYRYLARLTTARIKRP